MKQHIQVPERATGELMQEPHQEPCGRDAHQDDQNYQNINLRGSWSAVPLKEL